MLGGGLWGEGPGPGMPLESELRLGLRKAEAEGLGGDASSGSLVFTASAVGPWSETAFSGWTLPPTALCLARVHYK